VALPHAFTTSYLTHEPTRQFLERHKQYGYQGPLFLSPGRAVGWRLIPTIRDLRFMWEEMPQQLLDEQQQKVRDSLRHALINWACATGEATEYTDNVPWQCLHPVGHWYEIPNLVRNGVLTQLLTARPRLKYVLLCAASSSRTKPNWTVGCATAQRLTSRACANGSEARLRNAACALIQAFCCRTFWFPIGRLRFSFPRDSPVRFPELPCIVAPE
jgi:hypothetical protein